MACPHCADGAHTAICRYCNAVITYDGIGAWLDATDGDVCSGNDDLINENQPHVPGAFILDSQFPV